MKTFFFLFFFFFGDHLILGGKNVRISDSGPKITLNFGEDIRIFEGLCLKSPPPKFSTSATGMGPPPIKNPGYAYATSTDLILVPFLLNSVRTGIFLSRNDGGLLV